MNTRASVAYGWGLLIVAGGGAYYFAKRSINRDRQERADAEARRRQVIHRLQMLQSEDTGGSDAKALRDKSRHQASDPFKSKKGDRFS